MVDDNYIAIIGDGVGALITMGVLGHNGLPPAAITIYGDSPYPLANLARYTQAIGQQRMRSESSGHLKPVDFPGLALVEAWQRRSPWPLLGSIFDGYTPTLKLVLAQGEHLSEQMGFQQRKVTCRVACIRRYENPAFAIYDEGERLVGTAEHVILALGRPGGLVWPKAVEPWQNHPGVTHSYQSPQVRSGEHVLVIGSGMTAAHIWQAALKAGAQVTSLHRHPIHWQRLNAPRCAFGTAGIKAYQRLKTDQRLAYLNTIGQGSIPWRWHWEWRLWQARYQGRFSAHQAEVAQIQSQNNSQNQADKLILSLHNGMRLEVDKLICATGVQVDALGHPLIKQLVTTYQLPVQEGILRLANDFTLAPLSQADSLCAVVGSLARWALPVADTFAGIKYIARRLAVRLT